MESKKRNHKKGELTSGQLITVVILIISFVIILLFWRLYNWNPVIDKETCHESIVFRSSVNLGLIQSSKVVPLKCQTEKVCLSESGDNCENMVSTKENPVSKIRLTSDKEKARQQIIEQVADSMYDCHSMIGEGKLLFMPTGWSDNKYCLICTRFVLDEKAKAEIGDISYSEIYKKLSEKKTNGGKSYLSSMYPGWEDWRSSEKVFDELKKNSKDPEFQKLNFQDWKMDISNSGGFIVIGGLYRDGWATPLLVAGGAALGGIVGGTLIMTGVGAPLGAAIIGTTAGGLSAGGVVLWYASPSDRFRYVPPSVQPYKVENLKALGCTSFETAP